MCPQIKAPIHSANSAKWMTFSEHISSMSCSSPDRAPCLRLHTTFKDSHKDGQRTKRQREEKENDWGKEQSLIFRKLKIHNLRHIKDTHGSCVSCPQFCQSICFSSLQISLRKHPAGYRIIFSLLSLPLVLPALLSLSFRAWHYPFVKAVKSVCEYSNPAIRKEGFVLLHSG